MSVAGRIRANLLLCDAAQVVIDKLYIMGGGWSYLWTQPGAPVAFVAALDIIVPWDLANRHLNVVVRIVTEDFEEVLSESTGEPVRAEGQLVVGRPPNARAGADLHVPTVIPFAPIHLTPGGYVCELLIDGEQIAYTGFQLGHLNQPLGGSA